MQSSQPNVIELAKKGDPKAIAFLINRQLNPKGITAKAGLNDTCLQIFLESEELPDQSTLMPFIRKGITNLGIGSLTNIQVYGRQTGTSAIAWTEAFSLATLEAAQTGFTGTLATSSDRDLAETDAVQRRATTFSAQAVTASSSSGSLSDSFSSDKLQEALKDFIEGLKIFVTNPVAGLPVFYKNLGKQRALMVGAVFGLFYIICLLFSFNRAFSGLYFLSRTAGFGATQVIALGATQFVSFVAASILTRKICRGFGSPEGDVFIGGTALLAPGLLLLLSSIFGAVNFEIVLIISVLSLTYLILTLYTGCSQISQIPEPLAPLAVVFMLLLSIWFSKIIISSAI